MRKYGFLSKNVYSGDETRISTVRNSETITPGIFSLNPNVFLEENFVAPKILRNESIVIQDFVDFFQYELLLSKY